MQIDLPSEFQISLQKDFNVGFEQLLISSKDIYFSSLSAFLVPISAVMKSISFLGLLAGEYSRP